MKIKTLLTALALIISIQFTQAQYLISATQIADRNEAQVQSLLNSWGWDTSSMTINAVISYNITYNTIDVLGNPTIASGAMYVPQLFCNIIPLVSYQHGTEYNKSNVPSNGAYVGQGLLYSGNGYITTLPDYLGMGVNEGIHPYLHSESEATASIDLMRAAREFLLDTLQIMDNNELFLTGYSQGGHSTMAIHKYITDNNLENEFNVVASAPMSGPYDTSTTVDFALESPTYPGTTYFPYLMASYQYIYENLYTSYDQYYDTPYDTIIADWIADGTSAPNFPDDFYEFVQDSVVDNIKNNPNHPFRVDGRDNDLYNWIPQEPVRMLYCTNDEIVTFENSILALDTMNAQGAPDVQAIDVFFNGSHGSCFFPATAYSLDWFNSLSDDCVLSIPSNKTESKIILYPNPVNDILTIENASNLEVESMVVYDILGRLAMLIESDFNHIDLSGLNSGVFFLRIETTAGVITKKIIKE